MADSGTSSGSGDWTAGIVAIVAALLLGSALPIGFYFGLYKPKLKARVEAEDKKKKLDSDMSIMIARQERVVKLENEAETMADRIEKLETPFAVADVDNRNVPDVVENLKHLAETNNLDIAPDHKRDRNPKIVFPGKHRIKFEHGLMATQLRIETQAYFHDFGRFLTEMETLENYVIVPYSIAAIGDSNGANQHVFRLIVYVIEKRDVESIGR
jgi:hypothetical protein